MNSVINLKGLFFVAILSLNFVQVTSETGTVVNITCDPLASLSNSSQTICQNETLPTIANGVQWHSKLRFNLRVPRLQLNSNLTFNNLKSLAIIGEPSLTTINCNTGGIGGAGIHIRDICETLTLQNLKLHSCGLLVSHEFKRSRQFISAMTLVQCRGVKISRLFIEGSEGLGIVIMNHLGGHVIINSSNFKDNKLKKEYIDQSLEGGGGVYIYLGHLQNLSNPLKYSPITLQFNNCTFETNKANTKYYGVIYTNIFGETKTGHGKGGGVAVTITRGISDVHVSFSYCAFVANEAFFGGGLSASTYRKQSDKVMRNITINIENSVFEDNGCSNVTHTYYGGGVYLSFSTTMNHLVIIDSSYLLKNVSFIRNCAKLGGGVLYFSDNVKGDANQHVNSTIVFEMCTFEQNRACIGSAIMFSPDIFEKLSTGYMYIIPTIKDCCFLENSVSVTIHKDKSHPNFGTLSIDGIGAIYASQYNFQFQGYNHFESNNGSAIYIVHGIINLQNSSVTFINNTGHDGGAVALMGSSRMIVGPNIYKFINNTANHKGGALYVSMVDITDFTCSRSCFIQYNDNESIFLSNTWNSTIIFTGNRASNDTAGHAIYATSLYPCEVVNSGNKSQNNFLIINTSEVFRVRGMKFDKDPLLQPQISTDGAILNGSKPLPLKIIPGQEYRHGVTIFNDIHQIVENSFTAVISTKTKNITIESPYVKNKIQLRGDPNQNTTLYLHATSFRRSYITLDVTLVECPPGFELDIHKKCICNAQAYTGLLNCDMENFQSYLKLGHWIGTLKSSDGQEHLVTSGCPLCDFGDKISAAPDEVVSLPQTRSKLDKAVCGETRTGVACGRCTENYTVHFHSPGFLCKPAEPFRCKLGWLFYIFSELLPVTVLFIIVLVFNISFTSGAVNGFVLFSQLLLTQDFYASGIITFSPSIKHNIKKWTQVYRIIYGIFNLDYFNSEPLSFCLWEGASALDMIAVKYITIIYALVLIMIFVCIMNKCGGILCCSKFCRITTIKTSVIHGISTFLIICYAQSVKVSLYLLSPVSFYSKDNQRFTPKPRVWFNGELLFLGKGHLPYVIPALLCLITLGLIPPVILLAYPMLNKVMALLRCEKCKAIELISQKLIIISRLKPLLDSIQGCYKDNYRFFAGIYLLSRFSFQLLYMQIGYLSYYVGVVGFLLFLITIHSISQPYIKRLHNNIDTLLLVNLMLINLLSLFNYCKICRHTNLQYEVAPAVLQLILIYLPLVVMSMYLLASVCRRYLCKCKAIAAVSSCLSRQRKNRIKKLVQLMNGNDDTDSEEDLSALEHDRPVAYQECHTARYHRAQSIVLDTYS